MGELWALLQGMKVMLVMPRHEIMRGFSGLNRWNLVLQVSLFYISRRMLYFFFFFLTLSSVQLVGLGLDTKGRT